jgi:cytochrome c553
MQIGMLLIGLTAAAALALGPARAENPTNDLGLSPDEAAGRVLFEETAGDIGCQSCHGPDATGTELAPDIRGQNEAAIIQNLRINQNMTFLALSTEDIEQLAAYLAYLRDNPLR